MTINHPPFYRRLWFKLLLPILIVGITCSTLLVFYLSVPMKSFLIRQFDADLRLASVLGIQVCEKSLNDLLELRLEKNDEMNQTMRQEALEEIKAISTHFPEIHLMVVRSGRVIESSLPDDMLPGQWTVPVFDGRDDTALDFRLGGQAVRAHVQYFPFWGWYVISFVFERDYAAPVRMAYTVTYLSAAGVFLAVVVTLLAVFTIFIRRPLTQLVNATDGIAEGRFSKMDTIVHNEFGRLMTSFNAMVDSLEKEKAEVRSLIGQLKESEDLFRSQFEYGNIGIAMIASDGSWIRVNDRFCSISGYSRDELYTTNWRKMTHPQDLAAEEARLGQMLAGEIEFYEVDKRALNRNGEIVFVHNNVSCVRNADGTVKLVIASILDITEKKKSDAELSNLRNYLSNIIDSMPSVLVGVDRDGNVTQWNRRAEQVTGIRVEDARSRPLAEVFPRLKCGAERIRDSIRDRKVIRDLKLPSRRERDLRYEDVTIYPLVTDDVEGAVIRVDDVTERVRLEEMMVQSEKMLSVGGLAAGMAHEVNNPLAGILQNAAVLSNRLTGDLPANHQAAEAAGTDMDAIRRYLDMRKLPQMLENIRQSGNMAAAIVKNMLSFARKSESVISSHDLGSLLDQSLELLQTDYDIKKRYDFKHIRIDRQYDSSAVPVPCEASKLQQVFMNILKNGAEAMYEWEDAPAPPAFVLRVRHAGDWMQVEIEDNGPGMDAQIRRRIFEPFFTTKPVDRGTGLGLSVSYFIITEDHGGEMGVHAADNGGTCFVVRLPKGGSQRT